MPVVQMSAIFREACPSVAPLSCGATDGQLLERFLDHRDEIAFTALVHRHGRMVLGVCRRVLQNTHDAEDAFQATFLVLASKAATIAPRSAVGAWLYGVACRTAKKAKAMSAKRRLKEQRFRERGRAEAPPDDVRDELQPLLDEELSRLPEKYQSAIVLCDLEGKTKKEAAGQLRCPEGTLSSWLVRGRRMLAERLSRRGVTLSVGALAAALGRDAASAGVRSGLVLSTDRAAAPFSVGHAAAAGTISAEVAALTEGVLRSMSSLSALKIATALLLTIGVVGAGVALEGYHVWASEPPGPPTQPARRAAAKAPVPRPDTEDAAVQSQIAKVLKAHGGDGLAQLKAFTLRVKTACGDGSKRDYHIFVQFPDTFRLDFSSEGREPSKVIVVTNKDRHWRKVNDGKATVEDFGLAKKHVKYLGPLALLQLKDPDMKVSLLGERGVGDTGSLLGDRTAVCVKLARKDGKQFVQLHDVESGGHVDEVRLYFDKESHLLLKAEFEEPNLQTEIFFSNYETVNGITVARKLARRVNGQVNYRSEVEFKSADKLDAALFEKPQ